ncbi:MAG: ParM/StbA family protein [Romboutsia sp.]|nr:ParM/StbA family protein [Romboutsia sp.]
MIKGIDIGNSITKDEKGYSFASKVTSIENILGSRYKLTLNDETYYASEGEYDTTYRKVEKDNYIKLLFAILSISGSLKNVQLMLGLPLSQYKKDRKILINKVQENFLMQGSLNGINKTFIIEDVEVYPEGVASLPNDYEGVLVDIGGLTTDCCMVTRVNGRLKIESPISLPIGTLNLFSDFINLINNKFGLDLKDKDSERIIKNGLMIRGKIQNIQFAINIFKEYLENLIRQLNLQYSLKTNKIVFTGGGSLLLRKPIEKRISYATILSNALFSNAEGFYKEGCRLWQQD